MNGILGKIVRASFTWDKSPSSSDAMVLIEEESPSMSTKVLCGCSFSIGVPRK